MLCDRELSSNIATAADLADIGVARDAVVLHLIEIPCIFGSAWSTASFGCASEVTSRPRRTARPRKPRPKSHSPRNRVRFVTKP